MDAIAVQLYLVCPRRTFRELGHQKAFHRLLPERAADISNGSIVDGELVALDPSGKPSFGLIQNSATSGARFVFFAFDLLQFEGKDLTGKPLAGWRGLLRSALRQNESVQLSESFQIPAEQMLALVRGHGLEGAVAKRLSSTYEQGRRSGAWAKMRVELSQELVIGGYTLGTHGFDAVIVGFYRGDQLHFCAAFVPPSSRPIAARFTRHSHRTRQKRAPS